MKATYVYFLVFVFYYAPAQTPFTTLSMEPIKVKTKNADVNSYTFNDTTDTDEETTKKPLDFFSNISLTTTLLNTGNRMSISADVLHYKLYMANPTEEKIKDRKYRFNLPLLLISKLATKYDSISSSSSWDALDYEAAPFTLRIMPSFKLQSASYNDVIYYGFYADVRGLNIQNASASTYSTEFIGSGGIGFTYEGDGEAGTYNKNGEYKSGRYSLSFLLQGATGKKEVLQKLFKTENDYVTSIQTYFLFKVAEESSFNLKIGYQYLFTETLAGTKSNFSIALGI
jgi:hypothetical protein